MLARRLLSAALGIPPLILVLLIGGGIYDAVLALVIFAATAEFLMQTGRSARSVSVWLAASAAAGLIVIAPARLSAVWSAPLALAVLAVVCFTAARGRAGAIARFVPVTVALYAGWLGQYLGLLRHLPHGLSWAALAFFTTFASDSGAYFAGRRWGSRPLAPRISPAKTVEGAVGGVVAAAVAAVALNLVTGLHQNGGFMLLLGAGISLAAQTGDLLESGLKRGLSVKDAGALVPGHGGLLDRLDSLLLVGAVLYYIVKWGSP